MLRSELIANVSHEIRTPLGLIKLPTDLAQLAREVIRSFKVRSATHLIVHNFVEPLMANVDGKRIEQVLRNLLSNAIKYSPGGGLILLQGYEDKGYAFIQVVDQGIGIAPEDVGRVFGRFYRVENAVTQREGGVGLGLPVCQRIVEAHGGHIWVESDLGQGSVFHVALPVRVERAAQPVPEGAVLPFGAGG